MIVDKFPKAGFGGFKDKEFFFFWFSMNIAKLFSRVNVWNSTVLQVRMKERV